MIENVPFGTAIAAASNGKRISRIGWNGKNMFVFMQVPSEIPAEVVPKMQSLPDHVKHEFERRFRVEGQSCIRYNNQLAIVYPDSSIYGWVASPSDVLAQDWCILD